MMTSLYGWTGRLLRVDLSTGKVSTMDTAEYVPQFLGGMGIAAKIAWDELEPGVGALDAENMLFIMVGPLTGTLASGGGRVLVAGIAPQQKPSIFSRSGMGGHWGAELKFAGFDGIVITGKAESPVYLWVHGGGGEEPTAEIRPADDADKGADIWGTGTYATTAALRALHGAKTRVVACGQAGENLGRIACIHTETGNAAGQGGFGAVMGSKNLKAVAVRGAGGVPIADSEGFMRVCLDASREGQSPWLPGGGGPGRRRDEAGDGTARFHKCGFCITPCMNRMHMSIPGEHLMGNYSASQQCWGFMTPSRSGHIEARAAVADYGLNGWEISYGMIPWLQMCKQHGLIDDIQGVSIPVPDHEVMNLKDAAPVSAEFLGVLLPMITFRQGELGDALADGSCYAADRLFGGKGKEFLKRIYPRDWGQTNHWNGHWGTGGSVYFPFWLMPVLQWCVDTRDPASDSTHQFTEHVLRYCPEHGPERGPLTMEQARHVCDVVYGDPDVCDPVASYEKPDARALPAIFHHNRGMIVESMVLCDRENTRVFSMLAEDKVADTAHMSKLFSKATGYETSEAELDAAGERVFNLLRALDMRNFGRSREEDWKVAEDLTQPAFTDQIVLDLEQFAPMLDRYYELRGWNPANGYPTRDKLEALGLADVADALEPLGLLG